MRMCIKVCVCDNVCAYECMCTNRAPSYAYTHMLHSQGIPPSRPSTAGGDFRPGSASSSRPSTASRARRQAPAPPGDLQGGGGRRLKARLPQAPTSFRGRHPGARPPPAVKRKVPFQLILSSVAGDCHSSDDDDAGSMSKIMIQPEWFVGFGN